MSRHKGYERVKALGLPSCTSKTSAYSRWKGMLQRCYRPEVKDYPLYGARGITVCQRWRDDFLSFVEDMGQPPEGKTLDRIDSNGNYEPTNCRWATIEEQASNKRDTKKFTFNGESRTATEWARHLGLSKQLVINRLGRYGWPIDRALAEPPRSRPKSRQIAFQGEARTPVEWNRYLGFRPNTVQQRLGVGWTLERAFTQKQRRYGEIVR